MNLSFLHPDVLVLSPALLIPWALEHRRRSQERRRFFSQVALLREALRRRPWPARLERGLRPLIRSILLAALILAFAGPRWTRGGVPLDASSTVVLLDASYSMGARIDGRTAFERAKDDARALLKNMPETPGLVIFSDHVENALAPGATRDAWLSALNRASLSGRPTEAGVALRRAGELIHTARSGSLIVLSDLTAHGWNRLPDPMSDHLQLILADRSGLRHNGWILTAEWTDRSAAAVRVSSASSRALRLVRDRRPLEQVNASPDEDTTILLPAPIGEDSGRRWSVELSPDGLPEDDVFYLTEPRGGAFSLLVIDGAPGLAPVEDEAYFLRPLLREAEREGMTWRLVTIDEAVHALSGTTRWDALMMLNTGPLPAELLESITRWRSLGRPMFISAGDRLDLGALPGLPGRWGDLLENRSGVQPPDDAISIAGAFEWDKLQVDRRRAFYPAPNARPHWRCADGGPLWVEGETSLGRTLVWTTTMDRDWTNIPLKPVYPVFVRRVLDFLAERREVSRRQLHVGDALSWPWPPADRDVFLERPDGEIIRQHSTGGAWSYADTDQPGHYRVRADGDAKDIVFAVNLNAELESDLTPLDPRRLPASIRARMIWIRSDESVVERVAIGLGPADLAPWMAVLAALFFAAELTLLAGRR
jgi:hypothetical protein